MIIVKYDVIITYYHNVIQVLCNSNYVTSQLYIIVYYCGKFTKVLIAIFPNFKINWMSNRYESYDFYDSFNLFYQRAIFTEKQTSTLHFKSFIQPFKCRFLIGRLRYYVIITYLYILTLLYSFCHMILLYL